VTIQLHVSINIDRKRGIRKENATEAVETEEKATPPTFSSTSSSSAPEPAASDNSSSDMVPPARNS